MGALLFVLVVLVVAGCGGVRRAGRPLPARFVPVSLSALDDRDFVMLGTLHCASGRCYTIEGTTDGGESFTRMPAPAGLPREGTNPTLRFADPRDGFLWVPFSSGAFWSTNDGGKTWRRRTSPAVVAFATADGNAYAVFANCTPRRCSGYRLARGPASARRWTESPLPFAPASPIVEVAARGRNVWLLGSPRTQLPRHDLLARSSDGGQTFATGPGPCSPDLGGRLEPSSARVVWAVCPTGMMAAALRSSDGGATFAPLHTPPLVNSAQLAPASDQTAVLAANGAGRPLYRTSDGGASWQPLSHPGIDDYWFDVGFSDARVGTALVEIGARAAAIWRTTDGGATWSRIQRQ